MAKVVHFAKYFLPDVGGIESVVLSLAAGASSVGYFVSVVCFGKSRVEPIERINGIRVVRAPIMRIVSSQPISFAYIWSCVSEAKNADIVHLHYPNVIAALCIPFIARRTRLIVHWHSDIINKGVLGALVRPLEFLMLKRANIVIATSQAYANASDSLADFLNKVKVVPIGVPDVKLLNVHSAYNSFPSELEAQIAGRQMILAVGRLVSYKGFEVLIKATSNINDDVVVIIVGGGPLKGSLQFLIDSLGLSTRVFLVGRVSDKFLRALFDKAALFCLPSVTRAEAFGVVLLEAMASSLPIVASDIYGSGVPWVNSHEVCGLNVPVGDVGALALACNNILSSAALTKAFSKGARTRFLSNFVEEVFVTRILEIYSQSLLED
jgi:glycosyltransferase involved in cell wall biosynthesis